MQLLLNKDMIKPIDSPYNNPFLPVLKSDASYCLAQDLGFTNRAVLLIYMMVPNHYTSSSRYYFYIFTLPF